MTKYVGIPSDQLPEVLAIGRTDVRFAFISLSAREPSGRDAEYLEWHTLDHRAEQYRLGGMRNSLRLVSTAACREARAASAKPFDSVDHIMTYLFTGPEPMPAFMQLATALERGGRIPLRLPSVGYMTAELAGRTAARRVVAGADVIPWRPALGAYVLVEDGRRSAESLADAPGVAGVWWFHGAVAPEPFTGDARGRQITYCYLDQDPIEAAAGLAEAMQERWASGEIKGLMAAPFYAVAPFDWARHLPDR